MRTLPALVCDQPNGAPKHSETIETDIEPPIDLARKLACPHCGEVHLDACRGFKLTYLNTQKSQDELAELIAAHERGERTPNLPEVLRRAIATLRDTEERLDAMWQDHRWCGS